VIEAHERERPWWLLPPTRISSVWWLVIAVPLLWIDYVTGIYTQFPLVYVIPVSLAAYYSSRWAALTLAVAIPLAHLTFMVLEQGSANLFTLAVTATLRGSVIAFLALWFARLSEHERALHDEVQTLKGLLPICSFCKSIRNDAGEWERLEGFISRRSQTQFSHGMCPACHETHFGSLAERGKT
jgi:hypothetical protein